MSTCFIFVYNIYSGSLLLVCSGEHTRTSTFTLESIAPELVMSSFHHKALQHMKRIMPIILRYYNVWNQTTLNFNIQIIWASIPVFDIACSVRQPSTSNDRSWSTTAEFLNSNECLSNIFVQNMIPFRSIFNFFSLGRF